jgi:hypothetical protein
MTPTRRRPERRPRSKQDRTPLLHLRLDRDVLDALKAEAVRQRRYLGPVVQDAVLAYLDTGVTR